MTYNMYHHLHYKNIINILTENYSPLKIYQIKENMTRISLYSYNVKKRPHEHF